MATRSRDTSLQESIAPVATTTLDSISPPPVLPSAELSDAPAAPSVTAGSASIRLEGEAGGNTRADQTYPVSGGLAVTASGESFGIYVLRSRTILGSDKPTESELTLLKMVLSLANAHLPGPLVTLDEDRHSMLIAPMDIFTKPKWDITQVVPDHYEQHRASDVK